MDFAIIPLNPTTHKGLHVHAISMKILSLLFSLLLVPLSLLHAAPDSSISHTAPESSLPIHSTQAPSIALMDQKQIQDELKSIDSTLAKSNNPWLKRYTDYASYNRIMRQMHTLQDEVLHIDANDLRTLNEKRLAIETLERQLDMLKEAKSDPFKDLIQRPEITEIPTIKNPIAIIGGISFLNTLQSTKAQFTSNKESLESLLALIERKYSLLDSLHKLDKSPQITKELSLAQSELLEFQSAYNIISTSIDIYTKRYDEVYIQISNAIKKQTLKLIYIIIAILISIGIALGLKLLIKRYIADNERAYTTNKVINFFNITIIILILLFAYLENVTYLVAVLGFASAGLAIAMKDLFMSILGWFVIMLGGSVHVGDRVRVQKDGSIYIGDVLDISLLRITIYEDVTLTSFTDNRRAGRIIFIPNNFVFTMMIANYTHGGMQTVWDGIDFCITFDSNAQKALQIAQSVATKYARGYTQITKKQLRKMRDRYSLKNANVDPRVYSFIVPNGITISVWYQTNAYATLTLRSQISLEIMRSLLAEPDIFIAYETTKFIQSPHDGFANKPYEPSLSSPAQPQDSPSQ